MDDFGNLPVNQLDALGENFCREPKLGPHLRDHGGHKAFPTGPDHQGVDQDIGNMDNAGFQGVLR